MDSMYDLTEAEEREMERFLEAAAARLRAVPLLFQTLTREQFAALDAYDGPEVLGRLPRR